MLTKVAIGNFRSIERAELKLGRITVLFGATSAGKSSLFYALLALRNFVLNPAQPVDGLFNLGFQNLGGFDACIFNHQQYSAMHVETEFDLGIAGGLYSLDLRSDLAALKTRFSDGFEMSTTVAVPFNLSKNWSFTREIDGEKFTIHWNGIGSTVKPEEFSSENEFTAFRLAAYFNGPVESLKRIDICPHRRGFFKPNYTAVPLSPTPTTEDEVASLIISDHNAAPRISLDTTDIFGRDFRTFTPPGTATTFFQTMDRGARVPSWLVNDGFGVNQVVYMLSKIHRPDVQTILVEEPEVHLHPTIVRKFARAIARIALEDDKQIIFTTHSEQFLLSLLACVKEKLITPDDLICYHVTRPQRQSVFELQAVSPEGQISGGLSSFVESELADIRTFLETSEKA
ncbi:MAG TPA: ATP-binding protein [Thermoanaerobaculia bacterium]|nr:ATP-binding protein [Thermoanaerobaculia bacterium]